jgi:hypothetical protein
LAEAKPGFDMEINIEIDGKEEDHEDDVDEYESEEGQNEFET